MGSQDLGRSAGHQLILTEVCAYDWILAESWPDDLLQLAINTHKRQKERVIPSTMRDQYFVIVPSTILRYCIVLSSITVLIKRKVLKACFSKFVDVGRRSLVWDYGVLSGLVSMLEPPTDITKTN